MRFLVTGGTGYIGSACVKQLLIAGHEVIATTRRIADSMLINDFWQDISLDKLSWRELDLLQQDGWREAVLGCDVILHVASPVPKTISASFAELVVPAVTGVKTIMQAASGSSVKKIVLTSSIAAIKHNAQDILDHNSWANLSDGTISNYAFSKTYAELTAWQMHALLPDMPDLITIQPGFVLGAPAYPERRSASIAFMRKILKMPFILPFGFHVVPLMDVVNLHIAAALSDLNRVRLPCCSYDLTSLATIVKYLDLYDKKLQLNLPKFLFPKRYKSFLNDKIKIDCSVTEASLDWQIGSIEQSVVAMADFIKQYDNF